MEVEAYGHDVSSRCPATREEDDGNDRHSMIPKLFLLAPLLAPEHSSLKYPNQDPAGLLSAPL